MQVFHAVKNEIAVLFPVHPRTRNHLAALGICANGDTRLQLQKPLPYLEFLGLQTRATVVITDSGGIQEETTYLGVPCLTVRENTERPITVKLGTNTLIGRDLNRLRSELRAIIEGRQKQGSIPGLWDGAAAERIADVICKTSAPLSYEAAR